MWFWTYFPLQLVEISQINASKQTDIFSFFIFKGNLHDAKLIKNTTVKPKKGQILLSMQAVLVPQEKTEMSR